MKKAKKKKSAITWGKGTYTHRGTASSTHKSKALLYAGKAGLAGLAARAAHKAGEPTVRNIATAFSVAAAGLSIHHARKAKRGKIQKGKVVGLNYKGKSIHGNTLKIKRNVLGREFYNTVSGYVDMNY